MNDCCNRPGQEGFDVAVIGAGSAGFSAAIAAADLGAKVALTLRVLVTLVNWHAPVPVQSPVQPVKW